MAGNAFAPDAMDELFEIGGLTRRGRTRFALERPEAGFEFGTGCEAAATGRRRLSSMIFS